MVMSRHRRWVYSGGDKCRTRIPYISQFSVFRVCSVRECPEVDVRSWCDSYCSGMWLKMMSLVSELTSYA